MANPFPRDMHNQPFGIDTLVRAFDTQESFTVQGFASSGNSLSRGQIEEIADIVGADFVRYWHEVEVVRPGNNDSDPKNPVRVSADNIVWGS